jgi:hypothetical protein
MGIVPARAIVSIVPGIGQPLRDRRSGGTASARRGDSARYSPKELSALTFP